MDYFFKKGQPLMLVSQQVLVIPNQRDVDYYKSLIKLMGKKGKNYRQRQQQEEPVKKKNVITEQQLMDKSHMDRTDFIPLLTTESLYEPFIFEENNQVALRKIVSDLNYLLYTDFKNFWATILYNPTLKNCLSTCLSYLHRRWLNNYRYSKQSEEQFEANEDNQINYRRVKDEAIYEYTEGLMKVVLIIYHRIVSFNKENKELSDLYKISEEITRKYILDFPKLFELAELYGSVNPDIVKFIIKMYSKTLPTFYQTLTTNILPFLFKRMDELIRRLKTLTEREEYGVNYSYKRMNGRELSQGEEQLKKKIETLMEIISFTNIINSIIEYFPEDCQDHCYFNSQIQFIFENVFLQLQAAYKVWNYQSQEIKILNMINFILKQCIDYFVRFFDRCNDIIVLRNRKCSTVEAYLNSLERVFKQFGKRNTVSKKNQVRNILMYKIVQKQFDVLKMAQDMYAQETEEERGDFNLQYLKDFIIVLQSELKQEEYVNQDEPRQEQIQQETEAPFAEKEDSFDEEELDGALADQKQAQKKQQEQKKQQQQKIQKQPELQELEVLVPKRMRSEDYYSKLYANFSNKFYKGEYEDDYDDIADYDKRPLFFQEESSNSESESENERHLVSNINNLQNVTRLHSNHRVDRDNVRNTNVNKPKYERVNNNPAQNTNKLQQKPEKTKVKYIPKQAEEAIRDNHQVQQRPKQEKPREEEAQFEVREQGEQQKRGGQGFKKSNKGFNYKPKDKHEPVDKHRNTNKTRDFDKQTGGGKKYKER